MNRAVLVVIVDFLLISLVTLFNANKTPLTLQQKSGGETGVEIQSVQDMLDTLRQALAEERTTRTQLNTRLTQTQATLQEREQELNVTATQAQQLQTNLATATARVQQLSEERARLEERQQQTQAALGALQTQQNAAQADIQSLQSQLETARTESVASKSKLDAMQAELNARRNEAGKMQEQISSLQQTALATANAKEQLAADLGSARTEATLVRQQLDQTKSQVNTLAAEKNRAETQAETLAHGLTSLAKSVADDRPLTANAVYNDYLTNRLDLRFQAHRTALLGLGGNRNDESKTILFNDGKLDYVVYHLSQTPLPSWGGTPDWEQLTGSISHGSVTSSLALTWLLNLDPRILVSPVEGANAARLGVKVYRLAADPAQFQQAILVGSKEGYYGEVEFKLDPQHPQYLRMKSPVLGHIFGKFAPTRGDLVFSKKDELIGMMVNDSYCAVLKVISAQYGLRFGTSLGTQRTSLLGAAVAAQVQTLPFKLQ